jgi:hypothetical protein
VYVANIDKKVDKEDVRSFFEQLCGEGAGCGVRGAVAAVGVGVRQQKL